ncbi:hypothetical protein H2199_008975 [Coniosporium tulheliwenetii]|uniref:Uncharacterized protein n=1 Tax=Coniosporium tulheliwenetii TaxID=3383036 RepID=A0ACC2YH22_9PEZI|nr:hypothetical protein H2199_008975 [Cladosporium sp. JES 115]
MLSILNTLNTPSDRSTATFRSPSSVCGQVGGSANVETYNGQHMVSKRSTTLQLSDPTGKAVSQPVSKVTGEEGARADGEEADHVIGYIAATKLFK